MKYRCKVDGPFGKKGDVLDREGLLPFKWRPAGEVYKVSSIYMEDWPDLFEPIEEVKCEHIPDAGKMVKCERLYDHPILNDWSDGKLNQEFDNIYAILEGMRK